MGVRQQDPTVYLTIKELLGVPPDEPIFIQRAQDKFSTDNIVNYRNDVHNGVIETGSETLPEWEAEVGSIISDFRNWQRDNPDNVKAPD